MKQVDIISKYIEALTNDLPDNQAQLFARSWAEASEIHPESASKHELTLAIEKINGKIGILQLVSYGIFLAVIVDILKSWIVH